MSRHETHRTPTRTPLDAAEPGSRGAAPGRRSPLARDLRIATSRIATHARARGLAVPQRELAAARTRLRHCRTAEATSRRRIRRRRDAGVAAARLARRARRSRPLRGRGGRPSAVRRGVARAGALVDARRRRDALVRRLRTRPLRTARGDRDAAAPRARRRRRRARLGDLRSRHDVRHRHTRDPRAALAQPHRRQRGRARRSAGRPREAPRPARRRRGAARRCASTSSRPRKNSPTRRCWSPCSRCARRSKTTSAPTGSAASTRPSPPARLPKAHRRLEPAGSHHCASSGSSTNTSARFGDASSSVSSPRKPPLWWAHRRA